MDTGDNLMVEGHLIDRKCRGDAPSSVGQRAGAELPT